MEAQAVADVRRQRGDIDPAGLGQIALGDGAGDRNALRPTVPAHGRYCSPFATGR